MTSPASAGQGESPSPGGAPGDPAVGAAARHVRHRNCLSTTAWFFLVLFVLGLLGYFATLDPDSQPAPHWFLALVIAFGVVGTALGLVVRREDAALRRLPAEVQAQARALVGPRWSPLVVWFSMVYAVCAILLGLLVISVPMTLDAAGYLAKVGPTATFTPRSHTYSCDDNGDCTQVTDGVLGTGASATGYTWPSVVPLGRPFVVRKDLLPWPPLDFNFTNDADAAGFLCIGLLLIAGAAAVVWYAAGGWKKATSARVYIPLNVWNNGY